MLNNERTGFLNGGLDNSLDILRTEKTRVDRGSTTRAAAAAAGSETIVNGARAAAVALAFNRYK
ncbi:hypothetical protein Pmar_PMAR003473 [Perkinsus marinus ATCC 50983]|uniref:Uncharacterized protein n=1 Tax=Perkinsus marinus (strain ATCC 50983 / TXsc) TaxID=423536 RepID=C5KHE8_PERM5|nr:hypothetical protein Pmar_PMAR003473 [Perkinsus marinus ATCC 50983]EER16010.1 hypothetical protein Pmar_PMAR003473 [Perkinsus marinus ATCC 50983]|eukprot:XP_002784214.1 hypothetical protein Pmar_PMAR003473 [Perkinsus marinus ATCC 50983]